MPLPICICGSGCSVSCRAIPERTTRRTHNKIMTLIIASCARWECHHFDGISLLAASELMKMTTSGETNDESFAKTQIILFR